MKRRVLFVILGLAVGGAERQLLRLLPRAEFEVKLVSLTNEDAIGKEIEAAGVDVRYLGLRRDLLNLPIVLERFRRIVREFRPDVAYAYLIHANLFTRIFARLFGVPRVICSVRNRQVGRPILSLVDRLTRSLVDVYVPNSPALVEVLIEQQRIDPARIVVIPNAIDVTEFDVDVDRAAQREALRLSPDAFVACCIAKLSPQKDHATLLRALAQLDGVTLLLAGDGPLRSSLTMLAAELGIAERVHFLGWRKDVVALMKASDVFVLPSEYEGMSNALMEAMASGTPVIASDIEENRVLIDHDHTGLLFAVSRVPSLVDAFRRARDPVLLRRLSANAFERIAQNDVQTLVARVGAVSRGDDVLDQGR